MDELIAGYRNFRRNRYETEALRYRKLGREGQAPHTLVISCCDSRVEPSVIFDAGPGDLFVVRNVANLVPPYEPDGEYHSTSAAVEFAVTGLEVKRILVMGHASCGGVNAFLQGLVDETHKTGFIGKWMSLLDPAVDAVEAIPMEEEGKRQKVMELASVKLSLDNLMSFPFVKERVEADTLKLYGGYFGIAEGVLQLYDAERGEFHPVSDTPED
jgi:carbonic anhydrase